MICGHCREFSTGVVKDLKAHWRGCARDGRWQKVAELKEEGRDKSASRLAKRILGIQGPAMTEETRERLEEYRRTHKEEIREKRLQRTAVRRRTLEVLAAGPRRARKGSG